MLGLTQLLSATEVTPQTPRKRLRSLSMEWQTPQNKKQLHDLQQIQLKGQLSDRQTRYVQQKIEHMIDENVWARALQTRQMEIERVHQDEAEAQDMVRVPIETPNDRFARIPELRAGREEGRRKKREAAAKKQAAAERKKTQAAAAQK